MHKYHAERNGIFKCPVISENKNRVSFQSFCKTAWEISRSRLHYYDFCRYYKQHLKTIYNGDICHRKELV